jgi:hypothetical protein
MASGLTDRIWSTRDWPLSPVLGGEASSQDTTESLTRWRYRNRCIFNTSLCWNPTERLMSTVHFRLFASRGPCWDSGRCVRPCADARRAGRWTSGPARPPRRSRPGSSQHHAGTVPGYWPLPGPRGLEDAGEEFSQPVGRQRVRFARALSIRYHCVRASLSGGVHSRARYQAFGDVAVPGLLLSTGCHTSRAYCTAPVRSPAYRGGDPSSTAAHPK